MVGDELNVLSAFMVVAEERSFTRASKRLNISTSGLSHAMKRLEEQVGIRLLSRTTRSVSATQAGEELLLNLRPAITEIRETLSRLSDPASIARAPGHATLRRRCSASTGV
jgi:DNA-binding transcriptional LysR family regulator